VIVETFPVGMLGCNCTILGDPATGEAIVIDGGDEVDTIATRLAAHGLRPRYLLHTHAHFDHIGALGPLRERVGGAGLLHPADKPLYAIMRDRMIVRGFYDHGYDPVPLDGDIADDDEYAAGTIKLRAIHTPGHTPGSTSFALELGGGATTLFTGDTLFRGAVGRWDLGGTSLEDIVTSIRTRLLDYPDDTRVVCGHGADTTIGTERATNPFLLA
jgi:glyoxylase-like metal-dependent hydrolase (beta-lactamase superfamily II)